MLTSRPPGFVPRPPTRLVFDEESQQHQNKAGSEVPPAPPPLQLLLLLLLLLLLPLLLTVVLQVSEKRPHAPQPPERSSERRSSKSQSAEPHREAPVQVQEFEPWNLGQEPSLPARSKGQQGAKPSLDLTSSPGRRQSASPPDVMVTGEEPYNIDTERHRSRVVISPQAAQEPEYTLEKKGHTSVIRVSYPGPEVTS